MTVNKSVFQISEKISPTTTIHVGESPKSISFSGCGFLGVYHIGVASCLKQHAKSLINNFDKIYGCSAGSLVAAMLLVDIGIDEVCQHTMDVVAKARSGILGPLSPGFKLNEILLKNLTEKLPMDAHLKTSGKLFVSLTRVYDCKNVIISDFATREELINVLLCSCFVPFYSGFVPPKYRGTYYVDGGISNNLPSFNDTITVSPWSGSSDICPRNDDESSLIDLIVVNTSIQATPSNIYRCSTMFFPPDPKVLRDFCTQGFQETVQYLQDHGLFESTHGLQKNLSFSTKINQKKIRQDLTRKLSMSENINQLNEGFKRVKTYSESGLVMKEITNDYPIVDQNPVLTVVHVYPIKTQSSMIQLHMLLPPAILKTLEKFIKNNNLPSTSLIKIVCNLVELPFNVSYKFAYEIVNKSENFPHSIKFLLINIRNVVKEIHSYFRCAGTKLLKLFERRKKNLKAYGKLLVQRLSIVTLLLAKELLKVGNIFIPIEISSKIEKLLNIFESFFAKDIFIVQ